MREMEKSTGTRFHEQAFATMSQAIQTNSLHSPKPPLFPSYGDFVVALNRTVACCVKPQQHLVSECLQQLLTCSVTPCKFCGDFSLTKQISASLYNSRMTGLTVALEGSSGDQLVQPVLVIGQTVCFISHS